jgi:hypothetical protein
MKSRRNELWYVGWAVGLLILLALYTNFVQAFAEVPPQDMACAPSTPIPNFTYVKCTFPYRISKFTAANAATDQHGALLVPTTAGLKKLRAHFYGYSAAPTVCDNNGFSDPNYITTKNCPSHYPNLNLYPGYFTAWGGAWNGELDYGWRIAALFKYVNDNYSNVDWGAGIELEGTSEGGATVILQSLLLPDPWARALITVVNAQVPQTLFVKTTDPIGGYWRNPVVQFTWGGFDWRKADIIANADKVKNIYYRLNGSPADTSVVFDLAFFTDFCDAKKIACMGTWHAAGHQPTEPGVNLPFYDLYSGPDMQARLDKPLVIFTHSTANYWGIRGHYNLGMEWNTASIQDTASRLAVPIRYRRVTGMGAGLPDQPLSATFDITLRRVRNFTLQSGESCHWTLGQQSGLATATAGVITITGLTLESSETYTELRIER